MKAGAGGNKSEHICAVGAGTYVDDALVVADEQVAEDAGFVQVTQTDHVLHPVDGGRVHGLDVCGVLRRDPVLLCKWEDKIEGL